MNAWRLVLILVLWMPVAAWSQPPEASTVPQVQPVPAKSPTPLGTRGNRSLTEQEISAGRFFSHQEASTLDSDGSGTVTLFELGDALRKRIARGRSGGGAAGVHATSPTPQLKSPETSGIQRSEASRERTQSEAFRARQLNEAGSLPSVAPNIVEKRF